MAIKQRKVFRVGGAKLTVKSESYDNDNGFGAVTSITFLSELCNFSLHEVAYPDAVDKMRAGTFTDSCGGSALYITKKGANHVLDSSNDMTCVEMKIPTDVFESICDFLQSVYDTIIFE